MNFCAPLDDIPINSKTIAQHKATLAALKKSGMNAKSGRLLFEALIYAPTASLEKLALKWIKKHPEHQYTPPLTALILKAFPDSDLSDFTRDLLQNYPLGMSLSYLIRAVLNSTKHRRRFYKLIENRMDSEPESFSWLGSLHTQKASKQVESLTIRWIELSKESKESYISCIATATSYPAAMEVIFDWLKGQTKYKGFLCFGIHGLYYQAGQNHPALLPKLIRYTRAFLKEHDRARDKDGDFARVYGALIEATGSNADIKTARAWFIRGKNRKKRFSWYILGAVLRCRSARSKDGVWAIAEAKSLLKSQSEEFWAPVLVGELLRACPDEEVLEMARSCLARVPLTWLGNLIEEKEEAALKT
ncbi:MAG: hypothetical protein H6677_27115 [Candidatus Obscuribacterales bacterium]|nr:hypothetical protein [Candidatus Obscuribacterales bacterium]